MLGSFLAAPAAGPRSGQSPTIKLSEITEQPGTVIGPYKLLEQIGEGGFGVVFMAEQTQPVRRKVALKVLKPGMDTRGCIPVLALRHAAGRRRPVPAAPAYGRGRLQYRLVRSSWLRYATRTCSSDSAPPASQNFSVPFIRRLICLIVDSTGALLIGRPRRR